MNLKIILFLSTFSLVLIGCSVSYGMELSPALELSRKDNLALQNFSRCAKEKVPLQDRVINSLITRVKYVLGFSFQATPDEVISGWFDEFKRSDYKGIYQNLRSSPGRANSWKKTFNEIEKSLDEVQQLADLSSLIFQYVDLGARGTGSACRQSADQVMLLVDQQRDYADSWRETMSFVQANRTSINSVEDQYKSLKKAETELALLQSHFNSLR